MHDRIHSCFGHYSPFVADLYGCDNRGSISTEASSSRDCSERDIDIAKIGKRKAVFSKASFPTILQQSSITTAMRLTRLSADDGASAEKDDIILQKLTEARCIRDATTLGLSQDFTSLRQFKGTDAVANELCREISQSMVLDQLHNTLAPFCTKYNVDFNKVLAENIDHLCRGKDVTEASILAACSLAYWCVTASEKCNAALAVLRAARVFGTPNSKIFDLATNSIQWAVGDLKMKEELFESRRLLQIDSIVIKYCGAAARNLFRVEDPRHSLRLFEFICDQGGRQNGVVRDALSLCHAFHHLSEIDAAGKTQRV
jgi:hypothetical protein